MGSELTTVTTAKGIDMIEPFTGVQVDVSSMMEVAESLERLRAMRENITEAVSYLTSVVAEESKTLGTKTIPAGSKSLVLSADHEITYDVEALSNLIDAGLPEERWAALVSPVVEYKVDRSVIKQLAANNPAYAEIIENAEQWKPKKQYVSLR